MRRSVRWTLFASVFTALALIVAACGGSDNNSSERRWRLDRHDQGKIAQARRAAV